MNLHKKKYNSKLVTMAMLFLTVVLFIWAMVFYNNSKKLIKESFYNLAKTTALTLSSVIEKSADDYKLLLETHNTETDFYIKTTSVFNDILKNSDVKNAYTVERIDENQIRYIIIGVDLNEPEILTPIGTTWETGEYANKAFDTNTVVITDFEYYPSWNETYMCVYAPIIDPANGKMLGLVGIDIQVDELIYQLNHLRDTAIITMCIMLLIIYNIFLMFSDKLVKLYVIDDLTGIYNRKFCNEYIKHLFDKAKRKKLPLSMLVIDIDHFKKINDTYGHPFGDVVLKSLSETITKNINKNDCFARYGGEEFVLLLENKNESSAIEIAENLRNVIQNLEIENNFVENPIKITISIGVGCTDQCDMRTYSELIEISDKALYVAKINRNSIIGYSSIVNDKSLI